MLLLSAMSVLKGGEPIHRQNLLYIQSFCFLIFQHVHGGLISDHVLKRPLVLYRKWVNGNLFSGFYLVETKFGGFYY